MVFRETSWQSSFVRKQRVRESLLFAKGVQNEKYVIILTNVCNLTARIAIIIVDSNSQKELHILCTLPEYL